ncbi:MAG: PadR family transcriptional regulator [Verrucomicrobiota bacterium]
MTRGNGIKERSDLLQGTLDLLILRTLQRGKLHGFAITESISVTSREALLVKEGSLYPALHRLEKRGFIEAEWGLSENNRRAKYYKLTRKGKTHLNSEVEYWSRFVSAVQGVLEG